MLQMNIGFLTAVGLFLSYFLEAVGLLCLFIALYIRVTPWQELALIRSGNTAAAVGLGGAILGFVLPLAGVIAHSVSMTDVLCWGAVALGIQLGAYFTIRLVVRSLPADIVAGNVAVAGLSAVISVAVGALNAACMVP